MISHDQKLLWMIKWCKMNQVTLQLNGECGFGRECVGILANELYPDYYWYNEEYKRMDSNGAVWIPEHAYHKHPCVAVLGRGEEAENELYEWLSWFNVNRFKVETGEVKIEETDPTTRAIKFALGHHLYARMVKLPGA